VVEALTWTVAIFAIGSLFALERRCLGQMAVVQPLVVCLVAGLISGNTETAVWVGISLQLFSVAQMRHVNWALGGTVAAVTLITAQKLGFTISVGGPSAYAVLLVALLMGLTACAIDKAYARIDGERIRGSAPWGDEDPVNALESLVHRSILRWLLLGGAQVTVGTGLALLVLYGIGLFGAVDPSPGIPWAALVPAIGAAMAVSSLAGYRFVAWTGLSTILSLVVFI